MSKANSLFGTHHDFLSHTLANAGYKASPFEITTQSGNIALVDTGILSLVPTHSADRAPGLILSAGIHGNETAPIELLSQLVNALAEGTIPFRRPTLIILGHPEAMKAEKRFIEYNMNRLFKGTHSNEAYKHSIDAKRASRVEEAVSEFSILHGVGEHYDLHTAIRKSEYKRFALYPFREASEPKINQIEVLKAFGIQALLMQAKPSHTFSSATADLYQAESYTLELGQVKPFGKNTLSDFNDVMSVLESLVQAKPIPCENKPIQRYRVVHEIIKTDESFRLNIPDDVSNFTPYPSGYRIWEDGKTCYQVQLQEELIIFPNPNVPIGQRAGLLIAPVHC